MRPYYLLLIFFFNCLVSASDEIPGMEINQIEENVFLHKSYSQVNGWGLVSSNGLVVVNNKGKAFIIDTPWSQGDTKKLVNWIQSKNYELLGSFSTHSHEDRTAGIKWLNDNSIATYATSLTNSILEKEGKEKARYSFESKEFELANGLLTVFYPGGGHTIDNVVVWLAKSKLLFGGCLVRSLESKGLGYTGEAYIEQWPSSVEKIISKYPEVQIVIPGHGKTGGIELLKYTKNVADEAATKSLQIR